MVARPMAVKKYIGETWLWTSIGGKNPMAGIMGQTCN